MSETKKFFEDEGVILVKNLCLQNVIQEVAEEYEKQYVKIERQEIPHDKPVVVLWQHVEGMSKKIGLFKEFPKLWSFISNVIAPYVKKNILSDREEIRLLETVIFNKPYQTSNTIHWHQDTSTWPLKPNNQFAAWIPFEKVDKESGALSYALGSHKGGIRRSVNLHTNEPYKDDNRKLIPKNPEEEGFKVKCMEMNSTDMLFHDGKTWHTSEPNKKLKRGRRGLSVRFIRGITRFDPNPGQAASFVKQITLSNFKKGDIIENLAFPIL